MVRGHSGSHGHSFLKTVLIRGWKCETCGCKQEPNSDLLCLRLHSDQNWQCSATVQGSTSFGLNVAKVINE